MLLKKNHIFTSANFLALLLAVGSYFFSISEASFAWHFPDEILASEMYRSRGLIGCTEFYYLKTTIQRIGNAFGVCSLSILVDLFESQYWGWVFARLCIYLLFPLSLAFFFIKILKIRRVHSLIIAFVILTVVTFLMSDTNTRPIYMYGLDLTAYGLASITFFLLISLLPFIQKSRLNFIIFCSLFFLNLTSQEAFLAISGFLIPIYLLYHNPKTSIARPFSLLKESIYNKKVWMLSAVWMTSFLVTILSPSFHRRQSMWPSSGTFYDGALYVALSVEETIYLLSQSIGFLVIFFLIGFFLRLNSKYTHTPGNKLLINFLLLVPFIFLGIIGFLTGLTPYYWSMPLRPEEYQFIGNILSNDPTGDKGAIGVRHSLFLFISIYLNVFLIGFLLAGTEKFKNIFKRNSYEKFTLNGVVILTVVISSLFHPDGIGSIRVLSNLFSKLNIEEYQLMQEEVPPPYKLTELFFTNNSGADAVENLFYSRNRLGQHESVIAGIVIDNHFMESRGGNVSPDILDLIYMGHKVPKVHVWRQKIYDVYGLVNKEDDFFLLSEQSQIGTKSYNNYGAEILEELFEDKKVRPPSEFHFTYLKGAKLDGKKFNCHILTDKPTDEEHYFASKRNTLVKGYNYFIFEQLINNSDTYIRFLTQNGSSVSFPWYSNKSMKEPWAFDGAENIRPVFRQNEDTGQVQKLKVVIYSEYNQPVEMLWHQGKNDEIHYQGSEKSKFYPCSGLSGIIK